jgi:hypothetical protein
MMCNYYETLDLRVCPSDSVVSDDTGRLILRDFNVP